MSAHASTYGPPSAFGARVANFRPGTRRRPDVPSLTTTGPGVYAALSGATASPVQLTPAPKKLYTSGGWHRGTALAHLRLRGDSTVVCEGGVLGESFNEELRRMDPVALHRLYLDYRDGVDALQHVDPDQLAQWRPADPDLLSARKHRRPQDTGEVRNSASVAAHVEFVCDKITAGLEDGSWICLGPHREVSERGEMPLLLSPLTVEPSKPRLCVNMSQTLNPACTFPNTPLEGLDAVQDNARGGPRYGAACDENAGYTHHRLDAASLVLFGVMFLGYVFVLATLPFGWSPSCYYHQWHGIIATAYYRTLGGLCSQYIDDHGVLSTELGAGASARATARRQVYAFYLLKGLYFGYYWSLAKTMWDVSLEIPILGLLLDTPHQAWRVPLDRRRVYRELGDMLLLQLSGDNAAVPLHLLTLARFAGKTVYYRRCCPSLTRHQNLQYSALAGRRLHGEVDAVTHRWWEVTASSQRKLSAKLRKLLRREIRRCVALVDTDRVHRFRGDAHVNVLVSARHYTDTTLDRFGVVMRGAADHDGSLPGRTPPDILYGGVVPEYVMDVYVAKCNTGVVELSGFVISLRIVDRHLHLRIRYADKHADFFLDNLEDVLLLRSGKVGGVYTVQKVQLMLEVHHFLDSWNCTGHFHHIASALNPADDDSRKLYSGEICLHRRLFLGLWERCGPFDVDCFASEATRQYRPDGTPLPYISRTYDVASRAINFFSQSWDRTPADRERLYLNPPFVLTPVVIRVLCQSRAHGVILTQELPHPLPAWCLLLERHTVRRWRLPPPHSKARRPEGFVTLDSSVGLLAYEFDFAADLNPSLRDAEVLAA